MDASELYTNKKEDASGETEVENMESDESDLPDPSQELEFFLDHPQVFREFLANRMPLHPPR